MAGVEGAVEPAAGGMDRSQTDAGCQGCWVGGGPGWRAGWEGAAQLRPLISGHCPKGCPILGTTRYKGMFTG